ncbi:MAG: galactarate dehydratase [Burkholderiaceae bacterium]
MSVKPVLIQMDAADNVAIVGNDGGLAKDTVLPSGLRLVQAIPQAHKVALHAIAKGAAICRYGVTIGYAMQDLPAGSWVHERVIQMPEPRNFEQLPMATKSPVPDPSKPDLSGATFMGYRNPDGSVGTRNLLGVTTTVQCVSGVLAHAMTRIQKELLPRYPHVDGAVALDHAYGCGVAIDAPDAVIPIRTVRNISLNPNFGGELMVVSLGCEKLQPERLLPPGSIALQPAAVEVGKAGETSAVGLDVVRLQDPKYVGFQSMVQAIVDGADRHLQRLNRRTRECVSVSELVVGVQCGGSDAFSGATANPVVGYATDLLVQAGATVMFSENTEVRDAVDQLTARAASEAVAADIVKELAWYDAYLQRGHVDRSANTTPGNKAGGLSNIVEKAMGSIVKSGTQAISHVLSPGEKLRRDQRGLVFAATPASDFICGTLQLAAGMNLHVFTTGRGTPYGLAECPVIKVATRTDLATRWHDLMDLNAGTVADGDSTLASSGLALFELMLEVASGAHQPWAERWGLHNQLVLFNPAPVT